MGRGAHGRRRPRAAASRRPRSPATGPGAHWNYIRSRPGDFLELTARKFAFFWNAVEVLDTEDQYTYARWSAVLRWSGRVFHFGVIVPLAVLGIAITWRRRSHLALLHALLWSYVASTVVFSVFARYRILVAPLLILFAASALVLGRDWLRSRPVRKRAPLLAVALAVAVFCNLPLIRIDPMRATMLANIGSALAERGRPDEAVAFYRDALEAHPSYAVAHLNLGSALHEQGDLGRAMEHYRSALQSHPEMARAHHNLALALAQQGRRDEAMRHYNESLRLEPRSPKTLNNLANLLQGAGRVEEAVGYYERALAIDPQDAGTHPQPRGGTGQAGPHAGGRGTPRTVAGH